MLTSELMQQIRRIEIHTRRLVNDSFAGEYHSVFKGRGMAFEEVRPYQPGDEIRLPDGVHRPAQALRRGTEEGVN